jgi:hypothetical protein
MLLPMENRAADQGTVSLRADVPEPLLQAMRQFIERHPNWDQYRLFQAALAGFLVQNGVKNRGVTRCYLANLFPSQKRFQGTDSDGMIPGVAADGLPSPALRETQLSRVRS